jgi:four helix bundle protein
MKEVKYKLINTGHMKNNLKALKAWKKSVDLTVNIYSSTAEFPIDERYGLQSQMRRAAVSVSSNIAEVADRNTKKEFNHFLGISNGSSYELLTQVVIANRLHLINDKKMNIPLEEIDELQKMTRRPKNYSLLQNKLNE